MCSTAGLLGGGSVSIGGGVGAGGAPTDVVQHQQDSCCSLQLKTGVQVGPLIIFISLVMFAIRRILNQGDRTWRKGLFKGNPQFSEQQKTSVILTNTQSR